MTKITFEQYIAEMNHAAELTKRLIAELRTLSETTKNREVRRRALRLASALGINSMHYQDAIKGSLKVLRHAVEEQQNRS